MSWNRKDDAPTTVDTIHDYLTDLQDLSENDEIPPSAFRDRGIWSLICREMKVEARGICEVVHGGAAAVDSGYEGADSNAAKEPARNPFAAERAANEGTTWLQ